MKLARQLLMITLALVFVGSISMVVAQTFQYKEGEEVNQEAAQLVELPDLTQLEPPVPPSSLLPELPEQEDTAASAAEEAAPQPEAAEPKPVYVDPYADALRNMDFSALQQVNEDVLGWILIPDTKISYPLLQGEDNEYYLSRSWRKKRNSTGSIYMECKNSSDLSDFNTILYGHRMSDRSMFGLLKKYAEPDYWQDHAVVYVTDPNGCHTYEIFAAFEVGVTEQTYRLGEFSDQDKQNFIDFSLERSVIQTNVIPTVNDQILTMSTCTGNGHETRWVVQAVLRGEAPSDAAQADDDSGIQSAEAVPSQQLPQPDGAEAAVEETVTEDAGPAAEAPEETSPISQDIRSD